MKSPYLEFWDPEISLQENLVYVYALGYYGRETVVEIDKTKLWKVFGKTIADEDREEYNHCESILIPGTENLYVFYCEKYIEDASRNNKSVVLRIPEIGVEIIGRCFICRKEHGEMINVTNDDVLLIKDRYLV